MNDTTRNHSKMRPESDPAPGFWRTRIGMGLVVALVLFGILLGYEHRVHILASGWLLVVVLLGGCIGMHFFMHGRHGGHGNGDGKS